MPFTADFTKSPPQLLLDLINYDNPGTTPITIDMLDFSEVVSLDGALATSVLLTPKATTEYNDTQTFFYNRVALYEVMVNRTDSITLDAPISSISDLIPRVNMHFGIHLTDDDFIDDVVLPVGTDPLEVQMIKVSAKPTSLLYVGYFKFDYVAGSRTLTVNHSDDVYANLRQFMASTLTMPGFL